MTPASSERRSTGRKSAKLTTSARKAAVWGLKPGALVTAQFWPLFSIQLPMLEMKVPAQIMTNSARWKTSPRPAGGREIWARSSVSIVDAPHVMPHIISGKRGHDSIPSAMPSSVCEGRAIESCPLLFDPTDFFGEGFAGGFGPGDGGPAEVEEAQETRGRLEADESCDVRMGGHAAAGPLGAQAQGAGGQMHQEHGTSDGRSEGYTSELQSRQY